MSRVLLVEDEEHLALGLQFNLENAGYEVELARTGEEALEALAAAAPDLVILDMKMPGMNGLELAAQIRRESAIDATQIVMLTSVGLVLTSREQEELQLNAQLSKPVRRRDLRRILAEEEPPGCAVTGFAVCTAGCDMSELGMGAGGARKVRMGARVRRALL